MYKYFYGLHWFYTQKNNQKFENSNFGTHGGTKSTVPFHLQFLPEPDLKNHRRSLPSSTTATTNSTNISFVSLCLLLYCLLKRYFSKL